MKKVILYLKILTNFILVIGGFLIALLVLPRLLSFFMPFVIGWIVAMLANPLVRFLEKKVKIVRKHSTAIIIVVVIAAIVGALYFLIAMVIKEVMNLSNDLPNIIGQVSAQFGNVSGKLQEISQKLPKNIQVVIDNFTNNVGSSFNNWVKSINPPTMGSLGNITKNIAEIFLIVIVTILSAYFFTISRDDLIEAARKHMPDSVTSGWRLIYNNFKTAFGGDFKAQFKIMLILTAIMFIAFEIMGISYSFLLAFAIAFLDLLPVFGTGAVLWPWAVIEVIGGHYMMAVGLIIIYVVCQVVKQVLQPKMVGDSIGISPLSTLVFMFVGYRLYGVLGMILGIPVGMVCINLYRIGAFDRIIRGFKIIAKDINEFRKF